MNITDIRDEFEKKNTVITYPRSPLTVSKIIKKYYSDKKIVFYGGGIHTKEILDNFESYEKFVAILDDNASCSFNTELRVLKTEAISSLVYDYVLISNSLFMENMHRMLLKQGVDENKIIDLYANKNFYDDFKETLNSNITIKKSNEKNILLIVPTENADHITRFSSYLKEDYNLYKLYYFSSAIQDFSENFVGIDSLGNSLYKLDYFLKKNSNNIDLVVINLIPNCYHLVYFIKMLYPSLKIVASVLDVLSFFGEKEKVISELEFKPRYDFELFCEDFFIKNCEGVILSSGGKYIEEHIIKKCKKHLHLYNYLPKKLYEYEEQGLESPIRLCYAGGVLPSKSNKKISADIKMYKVFEPALKQGFEVEAYFNKVDERSLTQNLYDDYEKLEKDYQFTMNGSLSIEKLLPKIKNAHFGIMFYDFNETKNIGILDKHMYSVVPTKIMTYLGAGLPIIISDEIHITKEYLLSKGVAISISSDEINHLEDVIKKVDYTQLKNNVKRFQKKYSVETMYNKLSQFLEEIF